MGIIVTRKRYNSVDSDDFTSINMETKPSNGVQVVSSNKLHKMHIATAGGERTTSRIAKKIREAKNFLGGRDKDGY